MEKSLGNQDTKRLLMEVSTKLFNEKNFDDVTINDICKAAGVTKGAFYHYFSSKYDIPIQQYREIQDLFYADYMNNANLPIQERFYKAIMWYSDYCNADNLNVFRNYNKAMLNTSKSRMMRKIDITTRVVQELLSQGIASGLFRQNINIPFYTEIITRFISSLIIDWTIFDGNLNLQLELAYLYRNVITMLS